MDDGMRWQRSIIVYVGRAVHLNGGQGDCDRCIAAGVGLHVASGIGARLGDLSFFLELVRSVRKGRGWPESDPRFKSVLFCPRRINGEYEGAHDRRGRV